MQQDDSLSDLNPTLESIRRDHLQWMPEVGIGYYPVVNNDSVVYDDGYFDKYVGYSQTDLGVALTKARVDFVRRNVYMSSPEVRKIVDVGIGSGDFIKEWNSCMASKCFGYDVNSKALEWLRGSGLLLNPWDSGVYAATFWDVLEHIKDPAPLLANVTDFVCLSAPIYEGVDHIARSKHYRKDEHCWYWTISGIKHFMGGFGFKMEAFSTFETTLGREDIGSFVFRRFN